MMDLHLPLRMRILPHIETDHLHMQAQHFIY